MKEGNAKETAHVSLPGTIEKDLALFTTELRKFYGQNLLSVSLFGSAVTGGFIPGKSDLNLLVVYSGLSIADLEKLSGLSRKWVRRGKLAPRFISLGNFRSSTGTFQLDFLDMKEGHRVLFGEDLLDSVKMEPAALLAQLRYEIKAMRMRFKQQVWKFLPDRKKMDSILLDRWNSLAVLSRGWMRLEGKVPPLDSAEVMRLACEGLFKNVEDYRGIPEFRGGKMKTDRPELLRLVESMMQFIRRFDEICDGIAL